MRKTNLQGVELLEDLSMRRSASNGFSALDIWSHVVIIQVGLFWMDPVEQEANSEKNSG